MPGRITDDNDVKFEVEEVNLNCGGYFMLAKLIVKIRDADGDGELKERVVMVNLNNKFDMLSNGQSLTGYHLLKREHLSSSVNDALVVNLDYLHMIDMFLSTAGEQSESSWNEDLISHITEKVRASV